MILKNRSFPSIILKLESLIRRAKLSKVEYDEINEELGRWRSGYIGEESLNYYFNQLPHNEYFILNDLRLPINNYHTQFDNLILTPSFFVNLEVKNLKGKLKFEHEFNQLIRINDEGKNNVFECPISQSKAQKAKFIQWLKKNNVPSIPIKSQVVLTNKNVSIINELDDKVVRENVIRASQLLYYLQELNFKYKETKLSLNETKRIAVQLMRAHEPLLLKSAEHNIPIKDITTGVHCPNCSHISMIKHYKSGWSCPKCLYFSKDAYIPTLIDYYFLISPTITNSEFRNFLHIESRFVAHRYLSSLNLPLLSGGKYTKYDLRPLVHQFIKIYKDHEKRMREWAKLQLNNH
ncbi:NERD domain-containing protein [Bacillus shivajii]|uniref:nuclease-related domain-containing protein n=1 Tax=Bacillus shivajii TaxID=1983719 RepID=UPI001CFB1B8B|nr:nuclease-related domain-containing protein [Bacillus shivajii]UCZ55101.1 NERD domain-containing protein [Bacillus shivajii]